MNTSKTGCNVTEAEYIKSAFNILFKWKKYGELTNEMGTKLLGFAPHVAPKAYVNVIYAPLDSAGLEELESRLDMSVPDGFKNYLRGANGLNAFIGEMRVFGLVPLTRKASMHVHNYPATVIVPNVTARIRGITKGDVVIGYYSQDGSYAILRRDGCVIRFLPRLTKSIESWESFGGWLNSEVSRLNESYLVENADYFK